MLEAELVEPSFKAKIKGFDGDEFTLTEITTETGPQLLCTGVLMSQNGLHNVSDGVVLEHSLLKGLVRGDLLSLYIQHQGAQEHSLNGAYYYRAQIRDITIFPTTFFERDLLFTYISKEILYTFWIFKKTREIFVTGRYGNVTIYPTLVRPKDRRHIISHMIPTFRRETAKSDDNLEFYTVNSNGDQRKWTSHFSLFGD